MSITEVAFAKTEKDGKALDPQIEEKIDKLWLPSSPFKLVDIFDTITINAKALIRQGIVSGRSIKPADAIHIATAQYVGVKAIHTYDRKMQNASSPCRLPLKSLAPINLRGIPVSDRSRSLYHSASALKQATAWRVPSRRGGDWRQLSSAMGQRSAKGQPG